MDALPHTSNPFRPTFGVSPLIWSGRQTVLLEFEKAILSQPGNPGRSIIVSGSRGIGKTVLLNEVEDIAQRNGWIVLRLSAREGMAQLLTESLVPEAVEKLEPSRKHHIEHISVAGVGSIGWNSDETQIAPRLSTRLRELLSLLKDTGVLITIDEVQDCDPQDLTTIAISFQDLVRDNEHIAIAMAGLTVGVNNLLNLPGTTFLRRARHYELGPLTIADARSNLVETAAGSGKEFSEEAADYAASFTQGYPYLVQLIGFLSWEKSDAAITLDTVEEARPEAIRILGTNVHQPSVRSVPARQREFLDAMADLETTSPNGEISISDIASSLGRKLNEISDSRAKLINRDLIVSAGHGKLEFAQPYLGSYLRSDDRPIRVN